MYRARLMVVQLTKDMLVQIFIGTTEVGRSISNVTNSLEEKKRIQWLGTHILANWFIKTRLNHYMIQNQLDTQLLLYTTC